ncbi:MAG: flagellar biosynthetic protein FliO [Fimbriimonadales bacterium]|nr:flagellar biosynthetic protein FliO [Armatimonadota bacterium]MCX7686897.1 flagellar biosynthetic protein FliO [Fimbriimonadales bacterium]GBC90928.1 hypothetical protein HRbin14_01683 [bacterium HR14]CUU34452.1 Flagellar biogenesis protein FliO [Armatimonadetes bacterium DC]
MRRLVWLASMQVILLWAAWGQGAPTNSELAPGALGTRSGSPMQVAAPSSSGGGWIQVSLALLMVGVGLRYGLPKLLRWAGKTGDGSPLDGQVRVIETRAVPNGSLMLVKARDRLLLIGSSPQGMSLLADLTPPPESAPLTADTPFDKVLRSARPYQPTADPQQAVAEQVQSRLHQARERLARLSGGSLQEGIRG